jgi:hypothetical protein
MVVVLVVWMGIICHDDKQQQQHVVMRITTTTTTKTRFTAAMQICFIFPTSHQVPLFENGTTLTLFLVLAEIDSKYDPVVV